ncbi:MAG: M20 family metallopeptidase [Alphaproteobacteria bacterium]
MLDPIELTQKLIQENTINPPGNEKILADYITYLFKPLNVDITEHYFDDNRSGLLIFIPGKKTTKTSLRPLAFTGHFDTVPIGNVPWVHDPFSGKIIGDKLYGRGTSDMKSGVAAFLAAIYNHIDIIKQGYGCLCILTACEELACQGAKKMVADDILPQEIGPLIIAEPTGNQIRIGHKGVFWLDINFKGKAAHGSMPNEGINAIEKAMNFIDELKIKLQEVPAHPDFGEITLNIGTIDGGTAINLVADNCNIRLDIRLTPNLSAENVTSIVDEIIKNYDASYKIIDAGDSIFTPKETEFVGLLSKAAQKVNADSHIYPPLTFFTDGSPILKAADCPAPIIYGPGETAMCHKVDEFAYVSKIKQAYAVYVQLIKDYNK